MRYRVDDNAVSNSNASHPVAVCNVRAHDDLRTQFVAWTMPRGQGLRCQGLRCKLTARRDTAGLESCSDDHSFDACHCRVTTRVCPTHDGISSSRSASLSRRQGTYSDGRSRTDCYVIMGRRSVHRLWCCSGSATRRVAVEVAGLY